MSKFTRRRVSQDFSNVKSLTQQSGKIECDIHHIVKRAKATGAFPVSPVPPVYGDGVVPDFHAAQTFIAGCNSMFHALPSDLRDRFHNDPSRFLEFAYNPDNRSSMVKLGISTAHLPPLSDPLPAAAGSSEAPAPKAVVPAAADVSVVVKPV